MAFLCLVLLWGAGCEPTIYQPGPPPPEAWLAVSDAFVDTTFDSLGEPSIRFRYRVDWRIDSSAFRHRAYRIGVVLGSGASDWFPRSRAIPIGDSVGSLRDTLSCTGWTCWWPYPSLRVLADIGAEQYLSVAVDSIGYDGAVRP